MCVCVYVCVCVCDAGGGAVGREIEREKKEIGVPEVRCRGVGAWGGLGGKCGEGVYVCVRGEGDGREQAPASERGREREQSRREREGAGERASDWWREGFRVQGSGT